MSLGNQAGQIIGQAEAQRSLQPAAVYSQVALMTGVSLLTIIAFNILRPSNKVIYEPKVKYHIGDKPPPRISDSLFGWVSPIVHTKEPELVDKIGLDAVAFLRFLRLLRWLFASISLLTCAILIPINIVQTTRNVTGIVNPLLMLTIQNVQGNWLFVHVGVSYIITIMVVLFVNRHWKEMLRLRQDWFRSPEYLQSFYARTLAVMHVPKKYQSDEGIKAIFQSLHVPYPTTSVHIGRKVGRLPELIDYHNKTVREFEAVLVQYLRGGKVAKRRPVIRIGGVMGCGGVQMDAIEFYTAKLKRTEAAIEEHRDKIDRRKAENFGFASMAAVPYAHIVARMLKSKHLHGTTITLAPNPKDIIWENMSKTELELAQKKAIGITWLLAVCFFYTVPLFIISILANLSAISAYVPFLQSWSTSSPRLFIIASGVLPPAVSGIFAFFLPLIMRWLSQFMGALTNSYLDRAVIARYFAFLVISQLVIFTLIGVGFIGVKDIVSQIGHHASIGEILKHLDSLLEVVNSTYIEQSSFWLTFFPLRGFLVIFDLAQIVNLVYTSVKTRLFGRTPRDIREWTQPPDFQYSIYYSNILFMAAVGFVFAPLAPLVVVAAAVVFWLSSWVYKYQLMFVFITKVETGGRLWNVVINRLLSCVILMQALLMLTIGLQYTFRSLFWLTTVPPVLIVIGFKIYINRTYGNAFDFFNATEEEIRHAHVHSELADNKSSRLEKRFGHPALHSELLTPMLHLKLMPLLSQVYSGRINRDVAKLNEYGGQKKEAHLVPGGIKIAAIDQRDLEYDPILYQRDRGELDWDARSVNMSVLMGDNESIMRSKTPSQYFTHDPNVQGYDRYAASTLGRQNDIELTPITSASELNQPLLNQYYYEQSPTAPSPRTRYSYTPSPAPAPPRPPTMYYGMDGNRQAPLHRPPSSGQYPSYE